MLSRIVFYNPVYILIELIDYAPGHRIWQVVATLFVFMYRLNPCHDFRHDINLNQTQIGVLVLHCKRIPIWCRFSVSLSIYSFDRYLMFMFLYVLCQTINRYALHSDLML